MLLFIYGPSHAQDKNRFWDEASHFVSLVGLPILIVGDLMILVLSKIKREVQILNFKDLLDF